LCEDDFQMSQTFYSVLQPALLILNHICVQVDFCLRLESKTWIVFFHLDH
jgi:hypothetical protein